MIGLSLLYTYLIDFNILKKGEGEMLNPDYLRKVAAALIGALIGIPSIAIGFYVTYQVVTTLGN